MTRSVTGIYDRYHYDPQKKEALEKWHAKLKALLEKKRDEARMDEAAIRKRRLAILAGYPVQI